MSAALLTFHILFTVAAVWAMYRLGQIQCGPEPPRMWDEAGVDIAVMILVLQLAPAVVVILLVWRARAKRTTGAAVAALAAAVVGAVLATGTLGFILLLGLGC